MPFDNLAEFNQLHMANSTALSKNIDFFLSECASGIFIEYRSMKLQSNYYDHNYCISRIAYLLVPRPPRSAVAGDYWIRVRLSVCLSVRLSVCLSTFQVGFYSATTPKLLGTIE